MLLLIDTIISLQIFVSFIECWQRGYLPGYAPDGRKIEIVDLKEAKRKCLRGKRFIFFSYFKTLDLYTINALNFQNHLVKD